MTFFLAKHLSALASMNLGLRLTTNTNEYRNGGVGDAVPLSHLAGADDIIEFITLASLPELQHETLLRIYDKYKQNDLKKNDCMPLLILYYAAKHGIGDAQERLAKTTYSPFFLSIKFRKIAAQTKILANFYQKTKTPMPLKDVISNLTSLAQELANNFNEKLDLRLNLNYDVFAIYDDMDYLFLSNSKPNFYRHDGYDFNNYPLGKVGRHSFESKDIVKQLLFLAGSYRTPENKEKHKIIICKAIKDILDQKLSTLLEKIHVSINKKLASKPDYPQNFSDACQQIIELIFRLQHNEQLSDDESIDLMQKIETLIDNPRSYVTFLKEAKKYEMLAGGRLSAYMLLVAGWAAKILTLTYIGQTWINLAHEKLDLLTGVEELTRLSMGLPSL